MGRFVTSDDFDNDIEDIISDDHYMIINYEAQTIVFVENYDAAVEYLRDLDQDELNRCKIVSCPGMEVKIPRFKLSLE